MTTPSKYNSVATAQDSKHGKNYDDGLHLNDLLTCMVFGYKYVWREEEKWDTVWEGKKVSFDRYGNKKAEAFVVFFNNIRGIINTNISITSRLVW